MLTKTENYFQQELQIKDDKLNKALHEVGKLVAKERNRSLVQQAGSRDAGRTEK